MKRIICTVVSLLILVSFSGCGSKKISEEEFNKMTEQIQRLVEQVYKEQKENMKEIVDTNSKLVKILDIEIANIKDSLDMSRDSNTYILEEVITGDGEKILKPRKLKKSRTKSVMRKIRKQNQ